MQSQRDAVARRAEPLPAAQDAGIFLVSFAVLLVELLLTRVFSVTLHYHLAFLVVSLAMLGFAASGVAVGLYHGASAGLRALPCFAALGLAIGTLTASALALRVSVGMNAAPGDMLRLALLYAGSLVPFFAGGLVVASLLAVNPQRTHRLYFFDLLGASLACAAFVPMIEWLGAPTALIFAASVAALGGATLAFPARGRGAFAVALAAALAAAAAANARTAFFDVRSAKGEAQERLLFAGWNAFSRVELAGRSDALERPGPPASHGFSARLPKAVRVPELYVRLDAGAATQVTGLPDRELSRLGHLGYDVTSAAYRLRRYARVLVIGPGGGRDVLTALHFGSGPVTAVEVNPLVIDLLRGPLREFTGGLYADWPGVEVVHDDGRAFVIRSQARFGLIQVSLVDTFAAAAAGAYALVENGLYTVEAMGDYLDRLAPDGVISFSRWFGDPPVEPLRLASIAGEALARRGVADASGHLLCVRTLQEDTGRPSVATILIGRRPFTRAEADSLATWAEAMGFALEYRPDASAGGQFAGAFHALLGPGRARFLEDWAYDATPVDDDRPFFFDRVPLVEWLLGRAGLLDTPRSRPELTQGAQTLLFCALVSILAALLFLLLSALAGSRAALTPRRLVWILYFLCLGFGFIVVEVTLIQRLTLVLGYPAYALSVVLFTLLAAGGIGSQLAGRRSWAELPALLGVLCLGLGLLALALPRLQALAAVPPAARIAAVAGMLAPLGMLMGMPFPSGLRRAAAEDPSLVGWGWAVNGAAAVMGSVACVVIAMTAGFRASLLAGLLAYAAAGVLAARLTRSPT